MDTGKCKQHDRDRILMHIEFYSNLHSFIGIGNGKFPVQQWEISHCLVLRFAPYLSHTCLQQIRDDPEEFFSAMDSKAKAGAVKRG